MSPPFFVDGHVLVYRLTERTLLLGVLRFELGPDVFLVHRVEHHLAQFEQFGKLPQLPTRAPTVLYSEGVNVARAHRAMLRDRRVVRARGEGLPKVLVQ